MKKSQTTKKIIGYLVLCATMFLFNTNLNAQLNLEVIGDGRITKNLNIGLPSANGQLFVEGNFQFNHNDRTFYMPGWTPGSNKQIITTVHDGKSTFAPITRFYSPNAEFVDLGIDTLGHFIIEADDIRRFTLDYNNGYVGIGTGELVQPTNMLQVKNDVTGQNVIHGEYTGAGSDVAAVYGENDDNDYYGYGVHGKGGYIGVYGNVTPTGDEAYRGVVGQVSGGSGENVGVWASASGTGRNYAVYASGDLKVTSQVFIGTSEAEEDLATDYSLAVDGKAIVEEMVVELSGDWPDYVFEKEYDLKSLTEVKSFIDENGHLPEIPSAAEMEASDGVAIGEMQRILVQKVEELTLYMIELEAQNKALAKQIEVLKKQ